MEKGGEGVDICWIFTYIYIYFFIDFCTWAIN